MKTIPTAGPRLSPRADEELDRRIERHREEEGDQHPDDHRARHPDHLEHDRDGEHDPDHGQDRARPETDEALVEHRIEHRERPGRPPRPSLARSHPAAAAPPTRHASGVSTPSRHSSGTGAWIAKALRRSFVNHRCNISLPCVRTEPFGQVPFAERSQTALVTAHADEMGVPAVDRTGGCRPAHAARDAEHGADQHRLVARLGGIDEGLGPARVEEAAVIAEAPLLCVQVADRVVARCASRQVRVEPSSPSPPSRHATGPWPSGRGRAAWLRLPAGRASQGRGRDTGAGGRRARDGSRERVSSAPVPACTTSPRAGLEAPPAPTPGRGERRSSEPRHCSRHLREHFRLRQHTSTASSAAAADGHDCFNVGYAGVAQW